MYIYRWWILGDGGYDGGLSGVLVYVCLVVFVVDWLLVEDGSIEGYPNMCKL